MGYVFRVLNRQDHETYALNKMFIAKKPISIDEPIFNALTQGASHIFNGSNHDYAWISVSKSYVTIMEKYSFSLVKPKYNAERPLVAILDNCDKLCVSPNDVNPRYPVSYYHKVIIDYSSDKACVESQRKGLVYSSKGVKYDNKNKPKAWPGYKYARRSQELIILNKVDFEDIKYILNPLEIDLLYAILKNNKDEDIDFILERLDGIDAEFMDFLLTYEEYFYFCYLYINNHYLEGLVPDRDDPFYKGVDPLELMAVLKEMKRHILKKILDKLGFVYDKVPIIEDFVYPVRKGVVDDKKNSFALFDDNFYPLDLPCLDVPTSPTEFIHDFDYFRLYEANGDDFFYLDGNNNVCLLDSQNKEDIIKKERTRKYSYFNK